MKTIRRIGQAVLTIILAVMIPLVLMGCKKDNEHPSGEHPSKIEHPSKAKQPTTTPATGKEHPSGEHPAGEHPSGEHPK